MRCSFKQNTRKLFIDLRNLSENDYFLFLFSIGDIFWTRITFERYDFQSATVILFIHGITKQFIKNFIALKNMAQELKYITEKKMQ